LSRRGRMVVEFTTTCAIVAYHHLSCEFEPHSWRGALDTTLCDKVYQCLATGRWLFPGTSVFTTNKSDRRDIAKILNYRSDDFATRNPDSIAFLFAITLTGSMEC
jgi:hypothetical protein